jgi:hypothetical protein
MPISGLFVLFVALCVLGGDAAGVAPVDFPATLLVLFNGTANSLANLLLTVGSVTTPGPECVARAVRLLCVCVVLVSRRHASRRVALIGLLETALSPFLVYALVGERPSGQTIAAGAMIVATLCCHAAYDMYLERSGKGSAGGAAENEAEEGQELLAAAPAEAGDDGEEDRNTS